MISTCFFVVFTLAAAAFAAPPKLQIVGGDAAMLCDLPSVVYLTIRKTYAIGYKVCAGTLISPTYVITAAHCLEGLIDYVDVNIGSMNKMEAGSQSMRADSIIVHANYTRSKYSIDNDIALIKLEKPVKNVDCVSPVEMAAKDDVFDNESCIIAGWGRTGLTESGSDVLLKAFLPVIPTEECKEKSLLTISTGFICAGDFTPGGASICKGDSGGPLFCPHENGIVLAGVTSYGLDCHRDTNVFSSIAYYRHWIDDIIG